MQTQILKGPLIAAIFSSIMAAQPLVQIRPSSWDVATSGVTLVPVDAPQHAVTLKTLLDADANLIAPMLPYSVLLVNGSPRKLRAMGVFFRWTNPKYPRGTTTILTALGKDDPMQLKPGEIKLFAPTKAVTNYLSIPPANRKPPITGSSVVPQVMSDFHNTFQQEMNRLAGLAGVEASIESLVFEDYQYLGPDDTLQLLQRRHPEIHR